VDGAQLIFSHLHNFQYCFDGISSASENAVLTLVIVEECLDVSDVWSNVVLVLDVDFPSFNAVLGVLGIVHV
jgi:hypothetical protein